MCDSAVKLRPLERDDLELVALWRRSSDASLAFLSPDPITVSGQGSWYEAYLKDKTDMMFVLCDADGHGVGTIALVDIDYRNQKAEFGRLLVADSVNRGKGFATAASLQLLEFARSQLHLSKIYLYVIGSNARAVKLYEKLGFHIEGCFDRDVFAQGGWLDVLRMSIFLDSSWERRSR